MPIWWSSFCRLSYFRDYLKTVLRRLLRHYRVSELEVRNLKRLEMIEKRNIFCISCLYLQEYKKEFAFLTKFHYFESRGGLNWAFKNFKNFKKKFWKKIVFSNAECVVSGHWNNEILLKMQILFCILEDTSM